MNGCSCCDPSGYSSLFSDKQARRDLKHYRRRGLDELAGYLVDEVDAKGATVLEVGGGIGAIGIELLGAGAVSARTVEISDGYRVVADELAAQEGVADRVDHAVFDFVEMSDQVPQADIVVLNRVVCCYPDMAAMVTAAADKSASRLAMVYPRNRWFMRALRRGIAIVMTARRNSFRFFVHPPAAIVATAEGRGLRHLVSRRTRAWELAIFERV